MMKRGLDLSESDSDSYSSRSARKKTRNDRAPNAGLIETPEEDSSLSDTISNHQPLVPLKQPRLPSIKPQLSGKKHEKNQYSIAWVCPLEREARAAMLLLDEIHQAHYIKNDMNSYTFGRMGNHNIIIATLPTGIYGNATAAMVVSHMRRTFGSLRSVLLVGIGAGIPTQENDIRLGDVVISQPNGHNGGVVQFDFGTEHSDGSFTLKGSLNKPSDILLAAVCSLTAGLDRNEMPLAHLMDGTPINANFRREEYRYPGEEHDHLFPPGYQCLNSGKSCRDCDRSHKDMRRPGPRSCSSPVIHCGVIASGNKLVRNPFLRDRLGGEHGAMCIEMEAAGVMDLLPCLVIRGICDYADSHKNNIWQDYAALTAAACAKLLLSHLNPSSLSGMSDWEGFSESQLNACRPGDEMSLVEKDSYLLRLFPTTDVSGPSKRHKGYIEKTHRGTWRAIQKDPIFVKWKDPNGRASTLCCFGEPGVGKSCMISCVIKLLERTQINSERKAGLAYIYCKHGDSEQGAKGLSALLASQLLLQAPASRRQIQKLCEKSLSADEILRAVCQNFDRVYFCLDGLDEIIREERNELLRVLKKAHSNGRVLFTARNYIRKEVLQQREDLGKFTELTVKASEEDIRSHVRHRIQDSGWDDLSISEVTKKMGEISQGSFLLADSLTSIFLEDTPSKTGNLLQKLPGTLNGAYSRMLEKMQSSANFEQANKILIWTVLSERPLKLSELQLALAVQAQAPGDLFDLDEENLVSQNDIESICQGLVLVDPADQTVRVFHLSFREYLRAETPPANDIRRVLVDGAQGALAHTCLRYLELPHVINFNRNNADESFERVSVDDLDIECALLDYASRFWGCHMRKSGQTDTALLQTAERHLSRDLIERYANQWLLCRSINKRYRPPDIRSLVFSFSRIHQATYFGLDFLLERLAHRSNCDINIPDCYGATPLHWAAGHGHERVTQLLLDKEADVNSRELSYMNGRTALACAIDWELVAADSADIQDPGLVRESARKVTSNIIRTLLKHGAATNCLYMPRDVGLDQVLLFPKGGTGGDLKKAILKGEGDILLQIQTPLMRASRFGNTEAMRQLLQFGADINVRSSSGWTALHWAVIHTQESAVKLLLDSGVEAEAEDSEGSTALDFALHDRESEIVKLLSRSMGPSAISLTTELSPSKEFVLVHCHRSDLAIPFKPVDPLAAASRLRETEMVQAMMMRKRRVDNPDEEGRTAFSWAAQNGDLKVMKALRRQGTKLETADHTGRTALSWAAQGGHIKAAQYLVDNKVNVNSADSFGLSPLMWAVIQKESSMVRFLLERGADIHARDEGRRTALSWASAIGDRDVIVILLDKDAVIDHSDREKGTPVIWAAATGNYQAVCLLLERGADEYQEDKNGHNALLWAVKGGHIEIVEGLHQRGMSLEGRDHEGRTPLHWAAGRGHRKVVKYLLSHGANAKARDNNDATALFWAAAGGHHRVVKRLLKKGCAGVNSADKDDSTAFFYFARYASTISICAKTQHIFSRPHHPMLPKEMTLRGDFDHIYWCSCQELIQSSTANNPLDFTEILSYSTMRESARTVTTLLEHGGKIDFQDRNGRTALSIAAAIGSPSPIQTLLAAGASPDSRDFLGRTPLSWAAGGKNAQRGLKLLLERCDRGTIDLKDKSGRTPLSWAAGTGNADSVQLLLENGASPSLVDEHGRSPLSWAVQRGEHRAVTRLMVNTGGPVYKDSTGRTLLSYAAEGGNEKTFRELLQRQPKDIDLADHSGRTPLSWVGGGPERGIQISFDRSPKPMETDCAMDVIDSFSRGNSKISEALLDAGADPEHRDHDHKTPLIWAAASGRTAILKSLLYHTVDIEAADENGRTALFHAIGARSWESIEILLKAGATPEHRDHQDRNAFIWAAVGGDHQLLVNLARFYHQRGKNVDLTGGGAILCLAVNCNKCGQQTRNQTFYLCDICAEKKETFTVCGSCFEDGVQCEERHGLIKCRVNDP